MSVSGRLRYRWRTLFARETLDAELDAELADHLDRETAANITRGMSPAAARRAARVEFGAVQRYKEEARDTRGLRWLEDLRQDLRFATRMIVKSPLFTGIVVVTLALGIGLNTAVFSVIDALLLRPLPGVRAPNELVQIYRTSPGNQRFNTSSVPHYIDVRKRSADVFAGVAAWSFVPMSVSTGDRPVRVFGGMVSANYFSVLGAQAALGRTFVPAEDEGRGAHPVSVLSDGAWKNLFGADPRVVGRTFLVNGQRVEVVGVTAPEFRGAMPIVSIALYMPLMQLGQLRPGSVSDFENRGNNIMNMVARLRPGVSLAQASARINAVSAELFAEFPEEYKNRGMNLVPQAKAGIHPSMRDAQLGLTAVVMCVVGLLLLVACVNVANLFLARASDRAREMAIRLALGARHGTLLRQLMVESLLFSLLAGGTGILVALAAISVANQITLPVDIDIRPDLRLSPLVLWFALGVTVLTGVVFGLVPAMQATRPSLLPALKGELPAGGSRSRVSRVLVVAQVALSMILLVSAGLFALNLQSVTTIDKGFSSDHLAIGEVDPTLQGYTSAAIDEFFQRLRERIRAQPSVQSVGFVDQLPLNLNGSDTGVEIPSYIPAENEGMSIQYAIASPDYFRTMGVALLRGRDFTQQDNANTMRVMVVNQRFVDRFWPGQNALGKLVNVGRSQYAVIGVVPTGKYKSLGEDPLAHMWFSQSQRSTFGMAIVVRTTGDPSAFLGTLRREVAALDPNLPLSNLRTMEQHLGITLLPARLAAVTLGIFGVLGLLLASVGIYGVMAYAVAQRTREIGIRMAIGASSGAVIRMIMRQGLSLVLIGSAIGLVGAMLASRLLAGILYGSNAIHPAAFAVVPLVLIAASAAATFIPARRAAAVDPAITLRSD